MDELTRQDPQIAKAIQLETNRQITKLELIASENFTSMRCASPWAASPTRKYAEGCRSKRYYGGCEFVDMAENLAMEQACRLFGAEYANVQPHSGSQANMGAYFAALQPGDTILGMNLSHGGHLTHGSPVNFSGRLFKTVFYGVEKETGRINYDEVEALANEHKPQMIIAGASAYPHWASNASAPSPTASGPSSWWTWPTSPALWPRACTPRPSATPTSPPRPRTRPCAARAAA
ncbi:hypothetical protein MASR2M17_23590 [Aminivibrio sp.]